MKQLMCGRPIKGLVLNNPTFLSLYFDFFSFFSFLFLGNIPNLTLSKRASLFFILSMYQVERKPFLHMLKHESVLASVEKAIVRTSTTKATQNKIYFDRLPPSYILIDKLFSFDGPEQTWSRSCVCIYIFDAAIKFSYPSSVIW